MAVTVVVVAVAAVAVGGVIRHGRGVERQSALVTGVSRWDEARQCWLCGSSQQLEPSRRLCIPWNTILTMHPQSRGLSILCSSISAVPRCLVSNTRYVYILSKEKEKACFEGVSMNRTTPQMVNFQRRRSLGATTSRFPPSLSATLALDAIRYPWLGTKGARKRQPAFNEVIQGHGISVCHMHAYNTMDAGVPFGGLVVGMAGLG